jgi:hypothetical protein
MPVKEIFYSETYKDDTYEYRHVILPPEQAQLVPRTHLLTETEWRNLGEKISKKINRKNKCLFRITNVSWMGTFYAT